VEQIYVCNAEPFVCNWYSYKAIGWMSEIVG